MFSLTERITSLLSDQPKGLIYPSWAQRLGVCDGVQRGNLQQDSLCFSNANVVFAPGVTCLCYLCRVGTATYYTIAGKRLLFLGFFILCCWPAAGLGDRKPDPVCWLSPVSPPFSVNLFNKTLSRMWFLWPHSCLIRWGLYLKAAQNWESSHSEFLLLAKCRMWWHAELPNGKDNVAST